MPKSIAGRTMLLLLFGLTISHILSVALYFMDRTNALVSAGEEHVGERIATVVQLIENAPEAERAQILSYLKSSSLHVEWAANRKVYSDSDENWKSNVLWKSLNSHLEKMGGRKFAIRHFVGSGEDAKGPQTRSDGLDSIYASVQLRDRGWLNFFAEIEAPKPLWSVRFSLSVIVMITTVLILSALVVHYLIQPLRVFSRAAERLGIDIHAPSLPESGPQEVLQATRAFNEMQERIRKLIDDRTRMLAAISHDLRTPITRLRLRADFIEDEEQSAKALRDLDEMETMISSLLSFAREDANEEPREIVDLVTLLQSVCDDMKDIGSAVTFEGEGRLPYSCSRLALRRAFTNLLENAVRYGGCARLTFSKSDDCAVVQIDDDGPGIPETEKEKAFDPFYRIEKSRNRETGGTGVGLYVARTIIRGHGGDIRLRNRCEGGLRAEIELPC